VCGEYGRAATARNLISQAPRFALSREEARQIIDTMQSVVAARWHGLVLEFGGSRRDADAIESAFVYPGFLYDAEDG
jgi:serine/threonine-protein kinase HipA